MSAATDRLDGFHRQDCTDPTCSGCYTIPAPPPDDESPDQRRTRRRREMLADGINPASKRALLWESRATCGDCEHHFTHRTNRTFHKCAKAPGGPTGGPATDVRVSWPACVLYEERQP